jgi:outer membrane protein W
MKKVYVLILSLASFTTYAQQQAGDLSIQFSGNYTSSSIEVAGRKTKFYAGNVYVKVGKFFTPNLELGLKPVLYFSPDVKINPKDANDIKYKLKTDFGMGLYGTYAFLLPGGKFMPYGGAELNYKPQGDDATLNLGPYAGVKYFLTEKINIDANINYLITLASTYGNDLQNVKISPTLQFNIGIGVLISKDNP